MPGVHWLLGIAGLAGLALAPAPPVAPPARPGAWHQVGPAAVSPPGKALHFVRTSLNPEALAFVVTSKSSRPIRVFWWTYCEFMSDDDVFEEHQGKVSRAGSVTVYPPVLEAATTCYVSVNATPPAKTRISAAVFAF